MAKNAIIKVNLFGEEIGTLGYESASDVSFFQYNPEYLKSGETINIFPVKGLIKRIPQMQIFRNYSGDTFRSLPPVIADSLPDMFGNIIFREWLGATRRDLKEITVLEQLAYVANRGMGALEYSPAKEIPKGTSIDIDEIVEVLKSVVHVKSNTMDKQLGSESLLNVFKIGSSAGGARPKILISEHKESGNIIPGDINYSADYNHYLVKLDLGDADYSRESIEYCYYLTAKYLQLDIMESFLIDGKHFATRRFDRVNGEKKHILTVSGLTGWDFKSIDYSSYENIFKLAIYLKVPHVQIEELFSRMVFNVVFHNTDDHLKNHSFVYDRYTDSWGLSPFYDATYSLNPLINYSKVKRALSISGKRTNITLGDIMEVAEKFTINNAKGIIQRTNDSISYWIEVAKANSVPDRIIERIVNDFQRIL